MSAAIADPVHQPAAGKPLRAFLWVAQVVLALIFCGSGLAKLSLPISELAAMMKWPGDVAPVFVRVVGVVDLAGGLGVLLPALTRIYPALTVLAALGCIALQALAIAFHVVRGEFSVLPLNLLLITLAIFVWWGRSRRAPIDPRSRPRKVSERA